MTGESLLVLGGTAQQLPVIEAAQRRGLRVVAIDPDPEAPGSAVVEKFVVSDLADVDACLAIAREARPIGVLTFAADYPVPMVARIAAELGLAGPSPAAALAMTDKLIMRQRLSAAGLRTPRFAAVRCPGDLNAFGGSAVVKATRSSGSRGVRLVEGQDVAALIEEMSAESADGEVLVEEYIEGPEVSVEAITTDSRTTILSVTDKLTSGPPELVELGHAQPSELIEQRPEIEALTRQAVRALGLTNGPSHTEIRIGSDGPVVIESAARFGGGFIASHLLRITAGIDAAHVAVTMALGEDVSIQQQGGPGAAVRFLTPEPGVVRSVTGLDEVRHRPEVVEAAVDVTVGDVVAPLRSARDRVGHVICCGRTAGDARLRVDEAANSIVIKTAPTP